MSIFPCFLTFRRNVTVSESVVHTINTAFLYDRVKDGIYCLSGKCPNVQPVVFLTMDKYILLNFIMNHFSLLYVRRQGFKS